MKKCAYLLDHALQLVAEQMLCLDMAWQWHHHCAAVARLVKDVFESAAGADAVNAVSDYLRSQRVTSLPDLQVSTMNLSCTDLLTL